MREIKGGIRKLSMMQKLVKNLEKGVRIVNLPHLLVQNWTSRHVLDLYNSPKKVILRRLILLREWNAKNLYQYYINQGHFLMSSFEQVDEVGSQSVLPTLSFHQFLHHTQFLNSSLHLSHI